MLAFKLILKQLLRKVSLVTVLLFIHTSVIMGQNFISNTHPYRITTDTIIKIDTIYIIDTIINKYQCIITDTIYEDLATNKIITNSSNKFEGHLGITLNQLAITHWAAGGESSGSGRITSNLSYTHNNSLFKYVINGIFAYGISNYTKDKRYEKSEDRCELSMTMSSNSNNNITFTSIASLKTQFTNGYEYPNDSIPISRFFAPAYLNISAGYNYNYKNILSFYISPIAGKITFVTDQKLANAGSYGVEGGYWSVYNGDSTWVNGKNSLTELGINVLIKYKQNFRNDISIFSTLNLYNNYMDPNKANRWNIDVDWETGVKFTINKQISATLHIHMIYDDNIKFTVTEVVDGKEITKQKPILQFKESLGISFLYKFATK